MGKQGELMVSVPGGQGQVYVPQQRQYSRWLAIRYVFAGLGSILFCVLYGYKVNLNVAIVVMVNHSAIHTTNIIKSENGSSGGGGSQCDFGGDVGDEAVQDGPFVWDETLQGLIKGSYFWGYLVSQLPAGRLAEMFSAKVVLLVSALLNILGCLLTPPFAYLHYSGVLVLRFLQGVGGGLSFPAMHVMIARWSPADERSFISSIIYAGMALGTVISMLLTGVISENLGWEASFYISGSLSMVWCILWVWLMSDSPENHPYITDEERDYIAESQAGSISHDKDAKVPWMQILSSLPFYAILLAHICSNFGWYMLLIELPTYMNQILKFKISANAALSSMPFLVMWFFSLTLSKVLGRLQAKNYIGITTARKTATLIASVIPAVSLIVVTYGGCDRVLVVAMMTIGTMAMGGMFSGFLTNHIDIAPNFAGTLIGITNTLATVPGFVVPIFVGVLTSGNQTIEQWRIVIFTIVGFLSLEAIVFTIFGSGEVQSWNAKESGDKHEKTEEEEERKKEIKD